MKLDVWVQDAELGQAVGVERQMKRRLGAYDRISHATVRLHRPSSNELSRPECQINLAVSGWGTMVFSSCGDNGSAALGRALDRLTEALDAFVFNDVHAIPAQEAHLFRLAES